MKDLMEQFVCVRMIQANTVDLAWFQMDYDQTFAVFFMNADGTIYGRYGTRSDHKEATREMSLEGLREAMTATLELHKNFPANKAALSGKQGHPPRFRTPQEYPSLSKFKRSLATDGIAMRDCMHCHQMRDAESLVYRNAGRPMPKEFLLTYPLPEVLGLTFDPARRAMVKAVALGSQAARAGFKAGDDVLRFEGQPIVSLADIQWVLQHAPVPSKLRAEISRDGKLHDLALSLEPGWRDKSDISWRETSWDFRRMVTGGLLLEDLSDEEREKAKIGKESLALRAEHVGEYGEHAAAKKAGVKPDDILVSYDGLTQRMTESQLLIHALQKRMKGEKVPITVQRGEQRLNFELPMQ